MKCPYCEGELECIDYYGKRRIAENYWDKPQSWIEKEGDIYICLNSKGFNNKEQAIEYAKQNNIKFNKEGWKEITCESSTFEGYFHTDKSGNISEGYPC